MKGIDPASARYAISQITDGDIFESFALDFLSKYLGYQFVPVGGIKDKGIDGLEHTFYRTGARKTIYQLSIQKDYRRKIIDSLEKLKQNKIGFTQFIYVTNQIVSNLDQLKDELIDKYGKAINIFDQNWFTVHVNDSLGTIHSYQIFIDSYLHEFNRPGKSFEIANLVDDPRLYVYLRQQIDELHNELKMEQILVDTLILYALEETDPEKDILLNREQIVTRIQQLVKFDPHQINDFIDERLQSLSKKPRRINYHKDKDGYCLQYDERIKTQNYNLNDAALYEAFRNDTQRLVDRIVRSELSSRIDFIALINDILNSLYYKQGIEFSEFVLHGSSAAALQKNLPDFVAEVVDNSQITSKLAEIKQSLLTIIRSIVYDGTINQKAFLKRLSLTYSMLFFLQCDPKLCTYFSALASKLNIYVGTSVIIPSLSERFLEEQNRRYTNLLISARKTGVKLFINDVILRELVGHFRMIRQIYEEDYRGNDGIYSNEASMYTIPYMVIRAYYYALNRGQVQNFDQYISTFTSPRMDRVQEDLTSWISHEFGIEFVPNSTMGIHLDKDELDRISSKLSQYKRGTERATQYKSKNDAEVMLTIFALRERDSEIGTQGIFGYRTWWLTSDITTQKAATEVAGTKYSVSCYMRPDFLYNYISVAPTKGQIDTTFVNMFPTLLGVNISTHLPENITEIIHKYVREHADESEARKISRISELVDDLKQDPANQTKEYVKRRANLWGRENRRRTRNR